MSRSFKTGITADGDVSAGGVLKSTASSGDEGGQIDLTKSVTNTTLTTGISIDVFQNRLRFFETGGTNRGYYIDISGGATSVGTNLVGGGGGMTNPMTTLGDIIYGGSSGTATSLAGNTTSTVKFLTSTGSGSAATAPAWTAFSGPNFTSSATSQMIYAPAPGSWATLSTGTGVTTALGSAVTGSGGIVLATAPTVTGLVTAAGTSSVAPITMTSGTNLTSPSAGAHEYDGTALYGTTSTTHGRGVIPTMLFTSGTNTFTSTTTAQNLFPSAQDTLQVAGSTTYLFEAAFSINVPASGELAHQLQFAIGGTATTTSWQWQSTAGAPSAVGGLPTSAGGSGNNGTTSGLSTLASVSTTSSASSSVYRATIIKGIIRVNGAGTLIPQIGFNTAPGSTPVGFANNYFMLTPVGSNTVAAVGVWG